MLEPLIKDVRSAAVSFVDRYLARASVAIPFVVALGFATAALAVDLTARLGAAKAFWILTALFVALGTLAGIALGVRERAAAAAAEAAHEPEAAALDGLGEVASEATQAAGRLPLGLLAPLLASPSAATVAAARLVGRNLPLVLLLALLVALLWPEETETGRPPGEEEDEADAMAPQTGAPAPAEADADPLREAA